MPSNWQPIVKPTVTYRIGTQSPVPSPWAGKQHDLNLMGGIRLNPRLGCQRPARCFEHVPETKPATTEYAQYGQHQWDWNLVRAQKGLRVEKYVYGPSIVVICTRGTTDKPNNTASSTKPLREIPWIGRSHYQAVAFGKVLESRCVKSFLRICHRIIMHLLREWNMVRH